jgi:hypothetical protein
VFNFDNYNDATYEDQLADRAKRAIDLNTELRKMKVTNAVEKQQQDNLQSLLDWIIGKQHQPIV